MKPLLTSQCFDCGQTRVMRIHRDESLPHFHEFADVMTGPVPDGWPYPDLAKKADRLDPDDREQLRRYVWARARQVERQKAKQ
jgi:hypothetical protein